jgi:hypothetical protein
MAGRSAVFAGDPLAQHARSLMRPATGLPAPHAAAPIQRQETSNVHRGFNPLVNASSMGRVGAASASPHPALN